MKESEPSKDENKPRETTEGKEIFSIESMDINQTESKHNIDNNISKHESQIKEENEEHKDEQENQDDNIQIVANNDAIDNNNEEEEVHNENEDNN